MRRVTAADGVKWDSFKYLFIHEHIYTDTI